MTIHSGHPFDSPESERDPVRRFRARVGSTVSLWTTGDGPARAGLTVSSYLLAAGDPAHALALIDADSDFGEAFEASGVAVLQLLEWEHRTLADAFAGQFPAPGGVFRLAEWTQSRWGPVVGGCSAWAGVHLVGPSRQVGWSQLVDCVVEHVEVAEEVAPLVHRRGRYQRPLSPPAPSLDRDEPPTTGG